MLSAISDTFSRDLSNTIVPASSFVIFKRFRMNATGNVYKADVEEVKKLMKQVWDTQKSMLSRQPSMKQ